MKRLLIVCLLLVLIPLQAQDSSGAVDCTAILEIWQIQGDTANCLDETVTTTTHNIVTAIGREGFFMQTLPEFVDGDEMTSDGIYVYTIRFPGNWINIGDVIGVEGAIEERFGTSAIRIPAQTRVTFTDIEAEMPDPVNLQAVDLSDYGGASHPLERYEGMLVSVTDAFVTGATNQFDEFNVTLDNTRSFRERGIEPDRTPEFRGMGLPEWDLNPEVVEIDPPETGLPVAQVPVGSTATVTGVLTYNFNDYQIFPVEVTVDMIDVSVRPVREREPGEFTIGTQNVENLFDTFDDPNRDDAFQDYVPATEADYALRLNKAAINIVEVLRSPDILALQEVENSRVLTDLIFRISELGESVRYAGCLIEGLEGRGIDVAYLVRTERITIFDCYQMPGARQVVRDFRIGSLFTRPPLVLDAEYVTESGESFPLTLINLHNRSLGSVDEERVQQKRYRQAMHVAQYVQARFDEDPDAHIVVLGDINAFQFTDGLVDVVGIIAGDPDTALLGPESDPLEPNLVNQLVRLPEDERYSYVFNGSAQVLDHILTSPALDAYVTDAQFGRSNADFPEGWFMDDSPFRSSDHDGFVIYVRPE